MYSFFSRILLFRVLALGALLLCAVGKGYGQRVYGSRDKINAVFDPGGLLGLGSVSGVKNRTNALGSDPSTYSEIRITLSLSSLLNAEAWQSVRFPATSIPPPESPIYIKFTPPSAALSLLSGVSIVRTIGDDAIKTGDEYKDEQLIDLLGLLSPDEPIEFELPIDDVDFDGVRIRNAGLLGAGATTRYYYTFFITPPTINTQDICQGEDVTLVVIDPPVNYTYKWYNSTGALLQDDDASDFTTSISSTSTFYVEAIDHDTPGKSYSSARIPVTVTVHPKPEAPIIHAE